MIERGAGNMVAEGTRRPVGSEPPRCTGPSGCAALILAAGRGKRLGGGRAKVLREVAGRSMLEWVIDAARGAGAERIVAVVGHDREAVVEALPTDAEWVVQSRPRGTADAVRAAEGALGDWPGIVWVLCGDVPLMRASTLAGLAEHHSEAGAACTVLTMELDDPARYGRVVRDTDGRVRRIVEFADATDEERGVRELNSGMYAFGATELFATLPRVSDDNAQGEFYLTDVVRLMIEDGLDVEAVRTDDPRECVGGDTPEALAALDEAMRVMRTGR